MKRILILLIFSLSCMNAYALLPGEIDEDAIIIDDKPKIRDFEHPDWFKASFLDLREDLDETVADGKKGLIVYYGQKHCAYCEALMKINFQLDDIVNYTRQHFEVVAIDIWGSRDVTDFNGEQISEKNLAEREKTNFTPSLVIYDKDGNEAMRMRGYYKPYKFRAALQFVVDDFYKQESFRDYLTRANPPGQIGPDNLYQQDFISKPPYALDRTRFKSARPLLVMFEQGKCHTCDILHSEPLEDAKNRQLLKQFEVVQLDMWSNMPVLTPAGERSTARKWAGQLGLFYAPTLIFFDEAGEEIIRVDSVASLYRLRAVLQYVLTKGYKEAPTFVLWREMQPLSESSDRPQ